MSEKFTVVCIDFRPYRRNTLRGFATIQIPELKLTIRDVAVHEHSNGARWASLPAKPQIDRDGVARRSSDGKIEYTTILEFEGRGVRDAFSGAVIRAVLEHAADAFNAEVA